LFPERWFDLVLVLTTETEVLFDRLSQRGYSDKKVQENMECEIMQIIQESAVESYDKNIVQILPSNTIEDLESNVERVAAWLDAFKANN
jgi:adenylate kinase